MAGEEWRSAGDSLYDNRYRRALQRNVRVRPLDVLRAIWYLAQLRRRFRSEDFSEIFGSMLKRRGHVPTDVARVNELVKAANIASLLYPGHQKCLDQAYALVKLMSLYGFECELKIGASRKPPIYFHAWVEFGGEILTDDEHRITGYFRSIQPMKAKLGG